MEVKIHFLFNNGYIIYNLDMGDNIFLVLENIFSNINRFSEYIFMILHNAIKEEKGDNIPKENPL